MVGQRKIGESTNYSATAASDAVCQASPPLWFRPHMTAALTTTVRDKETAKIKIYFYEYERMMGRVEKKVEKYRKILKKDK